MDANDSTGFGSGQITRAFFDGLEKLGIKGALAAFVIVAICGCLTAIIVFVFRAYLNHKKG